MQIACLPAVALTCPRGWVTRDVGGEAEYDADDVVIELLEHTPMFCFVFFLVVGSLRNNVLFVLQQIFSLWLNSADKFTHGVS